MSNDKHSHYKRLGRELAMQFLFQFDFAENEFEPDALSSFLERAAKEEGRSEDRRFRRAARYADKLVSAVLENLDTVDGKIQSLLSKDWTWDRLAMVDKAILRVAVAEMSFFDNVPTLVTINEAVEIAKRFGAESSRTFVNGLLDALKEGALARGNR